VPEVRKVFGKNLLFLRVGELPFLYPPMVFSQVNESLLESFVAGARTLLSPTGTETLYDFYCGYGLFGLSLAPFVRRVIGAESSHLAVAAAAENARRQKVSHARFVRTLLSAESAGTVTARSPANALMLLDPPRSGTAPGVIEALAGRHPRRVVHVFCNMEILSGELDRWKKAGYRPEQAIPFDMFPGTPELEMMVLLTPVETAIRS
jgi:tRNA/tmRNA/rRNA uracil-C5-methylase (TrmA/RlmC/RlmD family)